VWGVGGVWGVWGVGSLLTFDIPQTALVATLDTYDFIYTSFPSFLNVRSHARPSIYAIFCVIFWPWFSRAFACFMTLSLQNSTDLLKKMHQPRRH
jgi:hypothetical protein